MKVFGVVYLILNLLNGKRYVGQTVQPLKKRFNAHASCKTMPIGKAIRKYGKENFYCGVIKSCASKEELDYWEKFYIVALKSKNRKIGYNRTDGGEGTSGIERSPEYRAKLSAAMTGEKNHRYGKKNTPEHTARIVAANLGRKRKPGTGENIAAALRGKKHTKERCAHVSAAQRGDSPYKNLVAELDARNLSYAEFAKLMGFKQATSSRKMSGKRRFTDAERVKLVEIFEKPIEYLLEGEPPPEIKKSVKKKRAPRSQADCAKMSAKKRGYSPYKNLIAELDAHQLSYKALERLMGVTKSTIARKIRGEYNFNEQDKAKLVEIFGKPIEYLLERTAD